MEKLPQFIDVYPNKSDNPKAPSHRIMANIDGTYTELYVCWKDTTKAGLPRLSCKRPLPKPNPELGEVNPAEVPLTDPRTGHNASADQF